MIRNAIKIYKYCWIVNGWLNGIWMLVIFCFGFTFLSEKVNYGIIFGITMYYTSKNNFLHFRIVNMLPLKDSDKHKMIIGVNILEMLVLTIINSIASLLYLAIVCRFDKLSLIIELIIWMICMMLIGQAKFRIEHSIRWRKYSVVVEVAMLILILGVLVLAKLGNIVWSIVGIIVAQVIYYLNVRNVPFYRMLSKKEGGLLNENTDKK